MMLKNKVVERLAQLPHRMAVHAAPRLLPTDALSSVLAHVMQYKLSYDL
jgi:hypothetical protein